MKPLKLGVNIDHVATLRQARAGHEPSILEAAQLAIDSGADSITVHLREDRRHIQDKDVEDLRNELNLKLNLEMAATNEMLRKAEKIKPDYCCIVPEKREELTTEGGLDVIGAIDHLKQFCDSLKRCNIQVSLFIDPDLAQITAANEIGADAIEIHTGQYANTNNPQTEIQKIIDSARFANDIGLKVHAGHGLTKDNVGVIAAIPEIIELNIGHSIISRSIFVGLAEAIQEIKSSIQESRQ